MTKMTKMTHYRRSFTRGIGAVGFDRGDAMTKMTKMTHYRRSFTHGIQAGGSDWGR